MPGVFISYRREDSSAWAGRLFDILSTQYGRRSVFMDLDGIEGGDDFVTVIEDKLKLCDVLLAVIGNHWLTVADANGARRLDNPKDFVRLEIGKALERGVRVIPVLVGGAAMPRPEDLPGELRDLSDRQAIEVRDAHFHQDAEQLIELLHRTIHRAGLSGSVMQNRRAVVGIVAGIAAILALCGVFIFRDQGAAKSGAASPAVSAENVAGNWTATVKYDWGDSYPEKFHFELDGSDLAGTASFLRAERGIFDGRVAGNRISFTTKSLVSLNSDDKNYEDKHYYKGTLEGGVIRFTMMTDSSVESHVPIYFVASRISARQVNASNPSKSQAQ